VSNLVPAIVISTTVVIVTFAVLRGPHGSKQWDRAMFVVVVLAAVGICLRSWRQAPDRVPHPSIALLASAALLFGAARLERPWLTAKFWEGFGTSVALTAVGVCIVFWGLLALSESSTTVRRVLTGVVIVLGACDLLSLIRTATDFVDPGNNVYVLNEVLAPAAGKFPVSNFVAQYVSLYGWPLAWVRGLMSASSLANAAIIVLSCLSLAAVVLAVRVASRTLPPGYFWLAAVLVVPLVCVTTHHGAAAPRIGPLESSIGSFLQELPDRMFSAVLLSWLGLAELARIRNGQARPWALAALGVLAGLIAWNSQDLGVALVFAYTAVLWGVAPWRRVRTSMAYWLMGAIAGLAAYPAISVIAGSPVKPGYFALLSRTYENGFGAALIQVPGPVLVVLPILMVSTGVGWYLLCHQRAAEPAGPTHAEYAVLTLAFVGTWSLGAFVYFLNRSYASGQLQVLLLPCGVCLAALVSICLESRSTPRRGHPARWRPFPTRATVGLVPVVLAASLGFAAILQSPNPATALDALAHPAPAFSFPKELTALPDVRAAQAYVGHRGGSLAYFGENGNFIHLETGVPDSLLVDSPGLSVASPIIKRDTCFYLASHSTSWLVVSFTARIVYGDHPCGHYRIANVAGPLHGFLLHRTTGRHTRRGLDLGSS